MENEKDNHATNLIKTLKKNLKKALKEKNNANFVDQKKSVSSPAATGDKTSSISGTNETNNTSPKKRKRQKLKDTNSLDDKTDSSATTNVTFIKKYISISKNNRPTLGEILDPRYLQDLEAENGENTHDKVIANEGSCTTVILEEIKGKNGIPDAKIVSKGEDTNLDVIVTVKNNKKTKSKNRRQTMVDNTGPTMVSLNTCGKTEINHVATLEKKLIILDINGLLADIVFPRPMDVKEDKYISRRAIFKRPFLEDFLCFCFQRFHVGIWSSRTKENLDPVVDFLLGDLKKKLLFLWDSSNCRNTGMRTLEDNNKHLLVKDLRNIWNKNGPDNSWVKGTFNESNTLLLDDSPYKALLNPKYTGIFPASYCYKNRDDNFLGPKGILQTYLEGLAAADNIKTYVEQHPFGQRPIDEKSQHWRFYLRVLKGVNLPNQHTRT